MSDDGRTGGADAGPPVGFAALRERLAPYAELEDRILRQFLIVLHDRGHLELEELRRRPRSRSDAHDRRGNRPSAERWDRRVREWLDRRIFDEAARRFSAREVDELITVVLRRERSADLEDLASREKTPVGLVRRAVKEFRRLAHAGPPMRPSEILGTRVALIRRFLTDQLSLISVARDNVRLRDLNPVLDRMITAEPEGGRIGGKGAGLVLGWSIVQKALAGRPDWLERVALPETWYLTSDVHEAFIDHNRLQEFRNHKYRTIEELRREHELTVEIFCNSQLPPAVERRLAEMLEEIGPEPIIVRSSSLLEDSFGLAFSGMYKSIFLGNQGPLEKRLEALGDAIAEIYAGVCAPDPVSYRVRHHLEDMDERMGLLVQKVVGKRHGRWFLPLAAGVAYSVNDYAWHPEIRREDGLARLVLGLGTRAVDRMPDDYPRLAALGRPELRPESTAAETARTSQRFVDAIDLEADSFVSVPLDELLEAGWLEGAEGLVAKVRDGWIERVDAEPADRGGPWIATLDGLLESGPFAPVLREVLAAVQLAYGRPVDLEFAWDGGRLVLLQGRALARWDAAEIPWPDPPEERVLFRGRGRVPDGEVRDVRWMGWIDPRAWEKADDGVRERLTRAVGEIDGRLAGESVVWLGPGRWGSSNPDLGVPVRFSDVSHARALIEVARRLGDRTPEVSYGTHFFQDLVETGIHCLPLFPDEEDAVFREVWLLRAPNHLAELLPAAADLGLYLRLVRLADIRPGRFDLVLDGENGRLIGCWDA